VFHTREWARWLKSPLIRSIVTVYRYFADRFDDIRKLLILSDTSDATAPVTVSGSSRCMSPNVDEHVHVLVSDSMTTDRMSPSTGPQVLVRLLVGNLVLSACLAAAGYVLAVGSAGDANPPQILH
jgi:hypothetical protein